MEQVHTWRPPVQTASFLPHRTPQEQNHPSIAGAPAAFVNSFWEVEAERGDRVRDYGTSSHLSFHHQTHVLKVPKGVQLQEW